MREPLEGSDGGEEPPVKEVGIVGFGRCGRLAARLIAPAHPVVVTDRIDLAAEAAALEVAWGDLPTVASRPVVLLAVPIRALPVVLDRIAPHVRPGALVVDLSSVKARPLAWMVERLPAHARPVGTHPLFGPDSAREEGLRGRRIVICAVPGHQAAADEVEAEAVALGLQPIRAEAEAHDREMAHSQALVFLLARAMARAGIGPAAYGTAGEERLWSALRLVAGDSDELYEDIFGANALAGQVAARLLEALRAEIQLLGGAETRTPL